MRFIALSALAAHGQKRYARPIRKLWSGEIGIQSELA